MTAEIFRISVELLYSLLSILLVTIPITPATIKPMPATMINMVILMSLFLLLITGSPFESKYKNRSLTNHTKNSLSFRRQGNLSCCAKTFRRYERLFCLSRSYLTEITLPLIRFPLSGSFIFYRYRRIHRRIQGRTWADW